MRNFRRSLPYDVAWIPYPKEIVKNEIYSPEVKRRAIEAGIQEYEAQIESKEVACRYCRYESRLSRWITGPEYSLSHFGIILRCPRCETTVSHPPTPDI